MSHLPYVQTSVTPVVDWNGDQWRSLRAYLEHELVQTYKAMSKLTATNDETQQQKGRAALLEKLLNLDKVPGYSVPAP